jgi:hypothetical protein
MLAGSTISGSSSSSSTGSGSIACTTPAAVTRFVVFFEAAASYVADGSGSPLEQHKSMQVLRGAPTANLF